MPVLGITGGIATGKTLFTGCLTALHPGLQVFDSDARARGLTESDATILDAIRTEFGAGVFDTKGALNRAALREMVFAEPMKRKALEAILHPAIRHAWLDMAEANREQPGDPWLAVDIPLLFETGAETHFDKIIVIACSQATQRRRLMEKRNLTVQLAESMIVSQIPLATKIDRGDFAVWNDGLPEALQIQARLLSLHLFS